MKRIPKLSDSPAPSQLLLPEPPAHHLSIHLWCLCGAEGGVDWSPHAAGFFWLRNRAVTSNYYSLTLVYSQYTFSCSVCELYDWSTKKSIKVENILSFSLSHPLSRLRSLSVGNSHTHTHTHACLSHTGTLCVFRLEFGEIEKFQEIKDERQKLCVRSMQLILHQFYIVWRMCSSLQIMRSRCTLKG